SMTTRTFHVLTLTALLGVLALSGCGPDSNPPRAAPLASLGGSISGLTDPGLVLATSTGDTLSVAANATDFTMPTKLSVGESYAVTVLTQPASQLCQVVNGNGTVAGDVGTVAVQCGANTVSFATPGS